MPGPDGVGQVVNEWVEKADNDMLNATHTLNLGRRCPTDTVCFHAQQCVEKYLKALLVQERVDFPKVHDIEKIIALLPAGFFIPIKVEEQACLTRYAIAARYPGPGRIRIAEARKAVSIARRVRKAVRKVLRGIGQRSLFG